MPKRDFYINKVALEKLPMEIRNYAEGLRTFELNIEIYKRTVKGINFLSPLQQQIKEIDNSILEIKKYLEQAQENSDFSFIDSRMRDEALSLESLLDYYPAALIPNDVSNNDRHWSDLEELNERISKEIRTSGYELYNCFLKAG